ncbi:MAG: hypothetical protein ACR2PT_22145 [Endozoicomonas sp.]
MKEIVCVVILIFFSSLGYSSDLLLDEINLEDTSLWKQERINEGWSGSFESKMLMPFVKQLELRVSGLLPSSSFSGTEVLFNNLLAKIKALGKRENIYKELILIGFETAFLLTVHHNRLRTYYGEKIYCDCLFEGQNNENLRSLDFSLMAYDPKTFSDRLYLLRNFSTYEDEYEQNCGIFNFKIILPILDRDDVFFVPTMNSLDIELFLKLSPLRVFPIGLSFDAINRHDGQQWSPFVFYTHDIFHAFTQVRGIKGYEAENEEVSRLFFDLIDELKVTNSLISEPVTLLLFELLHERGQSFCGLSVESLYIAEHEGAIPSATRKIRSSAFPFKSQGDIEFYLREAGRQLVPLINKVNCDG